MIRYRPFQNWDPPALAEIWRTQPPLRGRVQAVTPPLLEKHIFAKPWFDRHGLIVACDGARPVGFAHVGFGANRDLDDIDRSAGTICQLQVAAHERRGEIALELLAAGEHHLRQHGAQQLFAGEQFPFTPFYVGFYGASHLPGVLASDVTATELFAAGGYKPAISRHLYRRQLAGFRPAVDRQWMQVRRRFVISRRDEVAPDNWFEANLWAWHDWTRFVLTLPDGGEPIISATFWDVQPLSLSWGVQTVGLVSLDDTPEAREAGLSSYLLGEALKHYLAEGYVEFEAQAPAGDQSLCALFQQLGLEPYDTAALWQKT
ncbi:MAG: GNAT family N-acetyltransferase [Pirellulaceae bacterium]|nr:GNAT family N-acetyltransferase [Pirellulaceae bacterium]